MGRTTFMKHLPFRTPQRPQDVHRDQPQRGDAQRGDTQRGDTQRGDAQRGAQRAFQNAAPHSHGPTPPGGAQGTGPDVYVSNRKGRAARDGSHPPRQSERTRTNELDQQVQQEPGINQSISRKALPENEGMQANTWYQDDMELNENSPPIGKKSSDLDSDPSVLRRATGISEISGTSPDTDLQRIGSRRTREDSSDSIAVLGKMYHHLRRVKIEFPSQHFEDDIPHSCSPEDIEKLLLGLIRAHKSAHQSAHDLDKALKTKDAEYESLKTKSNDAWARKKKDFEDKISTLKKENEKDVDHLKTVISVLRDEHASWEQRHDDKIKMIQEGHQSEKEAVANGYKLKIQNLEIEMRKMNSRHDGEVNKLENKHREQTAIFESAVKEDMAEKQRDFDNRMFQSQETLRTTMKRYETRLEEMTSRFNTEKTRMNYDFHNEKATLSSTIKSRGELYETQLTNVRKQNTDDKQKREAAYRIEMERKAEEIDKLKKEHECEKEKMRKLHDVEKSELEVKRVQENKSLRDDNEALKSALVKRDHFKAMSDHELAQRFQNLASEIDESARVRWDSRRESTWPFPDQLLRNSENERRTKQHVVQNSLWVILYEKIFCTPFRVLGDGGKPLELAWIEKYGQDRKSTGALAPCPRPTKESEKWRYDNMKICLEATSQPLMNWDPNYNVKQGYELSVKETTEDISQELAKVVSVSGSDKQRMSDLVRKAARLWLEVGQQRCRMFLLMSDSSKEPLRSGLAALDKDRTQELVVMPELRRIGNAQGERLEKDELVSDCKGRFSVFYG